jgi:hypothetical protein
VEFVKSQDKKEADANSEGCGKVTEKFHETQQEQKHVALDYEHTNINETAGDTSRNVKFCGEHETNLFGGWTFHNSTSTSATHNVIVNSSDKFMPITSKRIRNKEGPSIEERYIEKSLDTLRRTPQYWFNDDDLSDFQFFAIRYYSEKGDKDAVERLLKEARLDPSVENNEAIRIASKLGNTDVVQILVEDIRVDPTALDNDAICLACSNGHLDTVKVLLKSPQVTLCRPGFALNGAIVEATENLQFEVLHWLAVHALDSFDFKMWVGALEKQLRSMEEDCDFRLVALVPKLLELLLLINQKNPRLIWTIHGLDIPLIKKIMWEGKWEQSAVIGFQVITRYGGIPDDVGRELISTFCHF